MTLEEKIEQVKNFRPIDDTFFKVLADDIGVCQEMLRIILEDEKFIVKDVIVQSSERNLYGRSVRLDALCILGNGKKCNVEVQRSPDNSSPSCQFLPIPPSRLSSSQSPGIL